MATLTLFSPETVLGLSPFKALHQYGQRHWDSEGGLPHNSVDAIAQTPDGYLWIGTSEGLTRFDGVQFSVFNRSNTEAFKTNSVVALCVSRDGSLWIGTDGSGLILWKDGEFSNYGREVGFHATTVLALHQDADGTLWVGTQEGLYRIRKGVCTYVPSDTSYAIAFRAIHTRLNGEMWIGHAKGLARFEHGRLQDFGSRLGIPLENVSSFAETPDGSLWFGATTGLYRLKEGKVSVLKGVNGLASDTVRALEVDSRGTLWIGTNGGLNRWFDGHLVPDPVDETLSHGVVQSIYYQGEEGSLWIGTYGGLHQLRDYTFETYGSAEGLTNNDVNTLFEDRSGDVWAGSWGGGLNRKQGDRFVNVPWLPESQHKLLYSIAQGLDGSLWVATGGGLVRKQGKKLTLYGEKEGLDIESIRSLLTGADGSLWIGGQGRLSRFHEGRFTHYTAENGLPRGRVIALFEDRDGALWIGAKGGGLSRFNSGKFTTFTTRDGLPPASVVALHGDSQGNLWIGTKGGGLGRFKDGRFVSFARKTSALPVNVYRILEHEGYLWMSSDKGIFRVRKADLEAEANGTLEVAPTVAYGRADGMQSTYCNGEAHQPAGWKTRDGKLWFPTIRGIVVIDPNRLKFERPPRVLVESVVAGDGPIDLTKPVKTASGAGQLEFRYTAANLIDPQSLRFQYRLEGFDADWVDAGARRVAYYTNLPPGNYRFRARARGRDGTWSNSNAHVALYLEPRFYQTYWFYGLCVFSVFLFGAGFYQVRTRQQRQREQELVKLVGERTAELQREIVVRRQSEHDLKLAKDAAESANLAKSEFLANMSHEIRTPMNGILGTTELMLGTSATEEQTEYLQMVRTSADALMVVINDILDFSKIEAGKMELDPVEFTPHNTLDQVIRLMDIRAGEKGLKLTFEMSREVPQRLIGDAGRLRQVLINLVGNAIKFTDHGQVSLEVRLAPNDLEETRSQGDQAALAVDSLKLLFSVRDTGVGIAKDKQQVIFEAFSQADGSTTRKYGGTGLGLAISSRLVQMGGGKIWVESEPGHGSVFHFTMQFRLPEDAVSDVSVQPAEEVKKLTSQVQPTTHASCPSAKRSLRILVAEDNPVNQRLVVRLLEKRGHQPQVAPNGREAVSLLMTERFDLALMDVQMPEVNGFEATEEIRSYEAQILSGKVEAPSDSSFSETHHTRQRLPIIAMTAHALAGDRERCVEGGMDAYLSKPIRAQELMQLIDSVSQGMTNHN